MPSHYIAKEKKKKKNGRISAVTHVDPRDSRQVAAKVEPSRTAARAAGRKRLAALEGSPARAKQTTRKAPGSDPGSRGLTAGAKAKKKTTTRAGSLDPGSQGSAIKRSTAAKAGRQTATSRARTRLSQLEGSPVKKRKTTTSVGARDPGSQAQSIKRSQKTTAAAKAKAASDPGSRDLTAGGKRYKAKKVTSNGGSGVTRTRPKTQAKGTGSSVVRKKAPSSFSTSSRLAKQELDRKKKSQKKAIKSGQAARTARARRKSVL
jgi:hypothetical protein